MRFLLVLALLTLSGCVTYKVQSSPDLDFDDAVGEIASLDDLNRRLSVENRQIRATTATADQTEAVFCSEPLLTLLTLGLVPRICIDSYRAILSSSGHGGRTTLERDYRTKSVGGWLALLLLPFPDWKYGHEEDWSETIKLQILASPNRGHAN